MNAPTTQIPNVADDGALLAPGESDPGEGRKSVATMLVELCADLPLFHDPSGNGFAEIEMGTHREIWALASTAFSQWMARRYYQKTAKAANRTAVKDAVGTLEARARFDATERPVALRVGGDETRLFIDLGDARWRVIEVTSEGWRMLDRSPVAFVRTRNMRPMPEPSPSGSIAPLWSLLNVAEERRPLVAAWLLGALHPSGPYLVACLHGEQGTAKSSASRLLRQLVDPNEIPLRSPPKEERDLLVSAQSNRLLAIDNLSNVPPWLSDGLCRIATGGGFSARELFTNAEEFTLSLKRPILLNGIPDICTRPDLADRAVSIPLEVIDEAARLPESELHARFTASAPVIFGGLLDALVLAIRNLPQTPASGFRMADAMRWAIAGETAFGWKAGTIAAAYRANIAHSALESVEGNAVGCAIRKLLDAEEKIDLTWSELLARLPVPDGARNGGHWPATPRALSAAVRRLAPALRRVGFSVEPWKGSDANGVTMESASASGR